MAKISPQTHEKKRKKKPFMQFFGANFNFFMIGYGTFLVFAKYLKKEGIEPVNYKIIKLIKIFFNYYFVKV